ncbi:unnamed protein product [Phaedon cochleariae]|uniref:Uncharacterized protein n=1 Tax=Phaedon cochleariae TaxID=80249 RepID=A0A9N9SIX4_PHACE|nr:unnamed protein product [Phaedon cochleariae]
MNESIQIECNYKGGEGRCGKRYLRNPIRTELAKELKINSALVTRCGRADELMEEGDVEPPHLYSLNILHKAKQELISSEHVHKDPLMALCLLKVGSLQGSIHNIGMDPFHVHFWSAHQLHVYRSTMKSGHVTLSIDATGGIIRKILKPNGDMSHNIFLYNTVASTEHSHYPLFHMLSESHNTNAIAYWIGEWCRMNIPIPKEIVCDSSKALLTAIVRAFTGFLTVEDYANALIHLKLPCYVRLDVAHFIKMYVNFLKGIKSKAVKSLYLSCIGQMILCEDVDTAAKLLLSILTIARCKTNGQKMTTGQETECTTHKKMLKQYLDPKYDEHDYYPEMNVEDSIFNCNDYHNEWSKWAIDIDIRAREIAATEDGDDENAHYFPELADRLVSDMKWLPLWSSIYRHKFGFGRHPATSAPAEIEFNLVKNHVFKLFPKPVRADVFVETYMKYLSGKIKIVDASTRSLENKSTSKENQQGLENHQHQSRHQLKDNMHILKDITNKVEVDFDTESNQETQCEAISVLQEIEDWGGLASEAIKNKSRYLRRNPQTYDNIILSSENERLTKIPILKNGNNPYLQAVKFKEKEYSFTNTCAFDSLVQIFLVGVCDDLHLREIFMGLKDNMKFAELILYIANKGTTQHAYRMRAEILRNLFDTTTNQSLMQNDKYHIVNCESNIVTLVCNIFGGLPSIQESTSCDKGCPPKIKNLRIVSIDPLCMTTSKLNNALSEFSSHEPRPCSRMEGCSGTEHTKVIKTGKIIFMEPIDFGMESPSIVIEKIGKELDNPCINIQPNQTNFKFLGLVNYKQPPMNTRKSYDAGMGHYTAITLRNKNYYFEFNDLADKPKKIMSTFKSHPHLLVYHQK